MQTLSEFIEVEGNGCTIGPNNFHVKDLTKGKDDCRVRPAWRLHTDLFSQARAGYLEHFDAFLAKAWTRSGVSRSTIRS